MWMLILKGHFSQIHGFFKAKEKDKLFFIALARVLKNRYVDSRPDSLETLYAFHIQGVLYGAC